jgi:hypothetical protein
MRGAALLAAMLAAASISVSAATAQEQELTGTPWKLTEADAAQLEAHVTLPASARPIAEYARYYSGLVSHGHHFIAAYYVRFPGFGRGRHLNEPAPDEVMDGGCGVIHFVYEVEAAATRGLWCNGEA